MDPTYPCIALLALTYVVAALAQRFAGSNWPRDYVCSDRRTCDHHHHH